MTTHRKCHCCAGTGRELDPAATGAAMRSLRISRRLTMQTVADRMDYSLSYLSDLERGVRKWNDSLVERFRKAVGCA